MIRKNATSILFCLAILSIYLSFSSSFHLPNAPSYFCVASLAIVVNLVFTIIHKEIAYGSFLVMFFLGWGILSGLWTKEMSVYLGGMTRITTFFLSVTASVILFSRCKKLSLFVLENLLGAFFVLSIVYYISFLKQNVSNGFCYPFGNPNMGSSVLSFALLVNGGFLIKHYGKKTFIPGVITFVWFSYFLVILSSEATILMLLCSVALTIFFLAKRKPYFAVGGVLLLLAFLPFYSIVIHKLWPSIEIRKFMWLDTLDMILFSPLTVLCGWGAGNFCFVSPLFRSTQSFSAVYSTKFIDYPHCFLLELSSELGLVGAGIFSCLIAVVYIGFLKKRHKSATDYAFAVATLFFFLHAQISVVFSYAHIQFLLAMIIGWYLHSLNKQTTFSVSRLVQLAYCAVVAIFWIFCVWNMITFHYDYKAAMKEKDPYVAMEKMLAIDLPVYEDFYTLQFRHQLGILLVSNYEKSPIFIKENIDTFDKLHQRIPGYGYYWLYKAVYYAKLHKVDLADEHFIKYSKKNPFDNTLWFYWGMAVRHKDASPQKFIACVDKIYEQYPEDGTLLMAKGICYYLQGEKQLAKEYLQKAQKWGSRRGLRHNEVREWSGEIEKLLYK